MQKIGGVWFLLLGIAMVGFSSYVQNKNPEAKMLLFIIVGAVFIAIGTFKLVSKAILQGHTKDSKPEVSPRLAELQRQKQQAMMQIERDKQAYANNQQVRSQQSSTPSVSSQPPSRIIACPKCFAQNYSSNNFCYSCGSRLR